MNFIYKELVKKHINILTVEHIKKYALTKNEILTDCEATIIHTHIKKYYLELLEGNTSSLKLLKQNLRNELFEKILLLYNESKTKYL